MTAEEYIGISVAGRRLHLDIGRTIAEKLNYNEHRADHKPEARAQAGGKAF